MFSVKKYIFYKTLLPFPLLLGCFANDARVCLISSSGASCLVFSKFAFYFLSTPYADTGK